MPEQNWAVLAGAAHLQVLSHAGISRPRRPRYARVLPDTAAIRRRSCMSASAASGTWPTRACVTESIPRRGLANN